MSQRTLFRLAAGLLVAAALLGAAYLLIDRGGVPPILSMERELEVTTADRIDSLAAVGEAVGTSVSVTGMVVEQGEAGSPLLLDDGMGLLPVLLPEPSYNLTGHRLFVRGPLVERDGRVVLEAVEWLYDSTAVRVHSE